VRIEWTCDPARTTTLVQRVFDEIAIVRNTVIGPRQEAAIHDGLLREFERNREDNRYFLEQIVRAYQDGNVEQAAAVEKQPERIAALTGAAIQQAAQRYFDTRIYVKVTLMPETK